jgi:hypothetical protein
MNARIYMLCEKTVIILHFCKKNALHTQKEDCVGLPISMLKPLQCDWFMFTYSVHQLFLLLPAVGSSIRLQVSVTYRSFWGYKIGCLRGI